MPAGRFALGEALLLGLAWVILRGSAKLPLALVAIFVIGAVGATVVGWFIFGVIKGVDLPNIPVVKGDKITVRLNLPTLNTIQRANVVIAPAAAVKPRIVRSGERSSVMGRSPRPIMPTMNRLLAGDVAYLHRNGADGGGRLLGRRGPGRRCGRLEGEGVP